MLRDGRCCRSRRHGCWGCKVERQVGQRRRGFTSKKSLSGRARRLEVRRAGCPRCLAGRGCPRPKAQLGPLRQGQVQQEAALV